MQVRVLAFVLAGGKGTRLYPLTKERAKFPTRNVSEMWRSDDLRLHLITTSTESAVKPGGDSLITQSVEEYRDIVQGANLDPALFQIPPGFNVTSPAGADRYVP